MKVFSTSLGVIFLVAVGLMTALGQLPMIIFSIYLGLSVVSFFMYWKDKNAARKNAQRTPENTLHLLALLGGWPGSLVGQQQLRHKTQKVSFRVVLWLTVIMNLCALAAYWYGTTTQ